METSQPDHSNNQLHSLAQNHPASVQDLDPDFFAFLKADEEKHSRSPSFFSENSLSQDIIQVTGAEPDVCLEVFYALYHVLWPQIEKLSNVSFKDAWMSFIGGSITKGILCPPEKLIAERRIRDLKQILSEDEGEAQIFRELDEVASSISDLKQKITEEIIYKKEIIASLNLIEGFYLGFRNQVKAYVQAILEKGQANVPYESESNALEDLLEPKAVMMSDIFRGHWAYRISRNKARKLLSLDIYGRIIKSNLRDPSNHRVVALPEKTLEPLVFFKANGNPPIQPEKEFMLYNLYRHLQIPVPETALLILTDVFEKNSEDFFAVQASEAVCGESPLKACQDPETVFDQEAYASQVIGALLTNPSDGSFKNFKYSPAYETLISIDNDLVFKPELTSENVVNVKSILYLLPRMDLPIPEAIKTFFTTLDPHLTGFAWVQDLYKKNKEYRLLFTKLTFQQTRCIYENLHPQSEVPSLATCLEQKVSVDSGLHEEPFYPQIFVSRNLMNSLTEKFQIIEGALLNNRSVSTQGLFEVVSPTLGKYYQKLRSKFGDLEEALEALWGGKSGGVDYSEISSLLGPEEFSSQFNNQNRGEENLAPEKFFREFQDKLKAEDSALDRFIRRHKERLKKNALNLRATLKELRFLIQQRLTNCKSPRDIVDFCHSLSKKIDHNHHLTKEIVSLLSSLPHPELKWLLTLERYFLRAERSIPKHLMSFSISVLGAVMKQRTLLLSECENQYLFDRQGDIKKNASLTGRSRVTCFPEEDPEFYLKQYPEWPGYEFASTMLMRSLGITQLPYQDLIIINNYPVLLSQRVSGVPVHHVWNNPKAFCNLDPLQTTLLIISAMLLNPEDGKEDNFILSEGGKYLITIDNDHCFLPSFFQKEGSFWNAFTVNTALQTKTLLFCLDEMNMPIPPDIQEYLQSINFDRLFTKWMFELNKLENQLNNLGDQTQRNRFLEQGTVMRIPFYKQFIENMHWKAHKIQGVLKAKAQSTPFDLLRAIEPFAAKCYEDSFKKGRDLQTRFKAATDQLYTKTAIDGSRVSILNTRTMMEIVNISEEELQKDAAFQRMGPVDALELLNQLSQERNERLQREQEMLCELDEQVQEKKWFGLFGNSLAETNLRDCFVNPKEGLALKGSKLIVRNKLVELFAQTPDKGMRIRFLSLPESPFLTDQEIRILAIECPNLEYLNVSGCRKLKHILTAEGEWPLLARLEAKDCLKLEKLISSSPMKILRIGSERVNEIFVEKFTLDMFTVSKPGSLFEFILKAGRDFQVKSFGQEVSNNDFIQKIFCKNKELEEYLKDIKITMGSHSISSVKDLAVFITVIDLQHSKISTEDIQRLVSLKLINLKRFCLEKNEIIGAHLLNYLVQADWPRLDYFSVGIIPHKGVQILAKGNWPLLQFMSLKSENVTEEGVKAITTQSKWPQLRHLNLSSFYDLTDEALEAFSGGNWTHLNTFSLSNKSLTKNQFLNLLLKANWPNLSKISLASCEDNFSKNLLRQNWSRLEELDLSFSKITRNEIELIVRRSNWPQLKHLNLSFNSGVDDRGIKILCQGDWPLLESLNLERTKLTASGVEAIVTRSRWLKLKHLDLSSNDEIGDKEMTILSQGDWPLLETLNLNDTKITAVGIEALVTQLKWLELRHLNLSLNVGIEDEGLAILTQGNWPLLETLNLENTGFTKNGVLNLLLQANWPNLKEINFDKFEKNFVNGLLQKNWPQLEQLDLSWCEIAQNEIELIVKRFNWPQLKCLDLYGNHHIGDQGMNTLCQGHWPLLEILNLKDTKITAVGIEAIVTRSKWPKLKSLNLSSNYGVKDEGLAILSEGDWPFLETLNLKLTGVTKRGLLNFFWKANWPNLKEFAWDRDSFAESLLPKNWPLLEKIDLKESKVTQKEVEIIVSKYQWPHLRHLNLSFNSGIDDEALQTLSRGNWPCLETLNLQWTYVTRKGLLNLLLRANWLRFKEITLSDVNCMGSKDPTLSSLAQSFIKKDLSRVERLELTNSKIRLPEIESIIKRNKHRCHELRYLNLSGNHIFGEGKVSVLVVTELSLLEELHLENTRLGSEGVKKIVNRSKWPMLKHLNVSNNDISDEGISALALADWPLLEILSLSNTKLELKRTETILNRPKWLQIKFLNISNNEISDEGLSVLALKEWSLLEDLNLKNTKITPQGIEILVNRMKLPNLKKLDISENAIFDEGLNILVSGNWPSFQHLLYYETKVTSEGHIVLLENLQWPNLSHLEHSFSESFSHFGKNLDEWSPPEFILALVPMYCETLVGPAQPFLVSILDLSWLNSKEIYLSMDYGGLKGKIMLLPREKLNQFDTINLSLEISPLQFIRWPSNLKTLDLSKSKLADATKLESLVRKNCPLVESLCIYEDTEIKTLGIEVLVRQSSWFNLKKLHISNNRLRSQELEALVSGEWQLLEDLDLVNTGIRAQHVEILVSRSNWLNLKKLNMSCNLIEDEGLEILVCGKWQLLEDLKILMTGITAKGIEALVSKYNWSNLKKLNIALNQIGDQGLEILTCGKWQSLEELILIRTGITARSLEILAVKSDWPVLKTLWIGHEDEILDEGLERLSYGKWPLLEKLALINVKITKKGIESMVEKSNWPSLKTLDVSCNENISGALAFILRKWPLLESLRLCLTKIALKDVETLANESSWVNLKELYLRERNSDCDEIFAIQKFISEKYPKLKVVLKDYNNLLFSELSGLDEKQVQFMWQLFTFDEKWFL